MTQAGYNLKCRSIAILIAVDDQPEVLRPIAVGQVPPWSSRSPAPSASAPSVPS